MSEQCEEEHSKELENALRAKNNLNAELQIALRARDWYQLQMKELRTSCNELAR